MNAMFHRLFAAALISQPVVAEQKNTDWMFCVVTDGYNDVAYVTDVFHGDYDKMTQANIWFVAC